MRRPERSRNVRRNAAAVTAAAVGGGDEMAVCRPEARGEGGRMIATGVMMVVMSKRLVGEDLIKKKKIGRSDKPEHGAANGAKRA